MTQAIAGRYMQASAARQRLLMEAGESISVDWQDIVSRVRQFSNNIIESDHETTKETIENQLADLKSHIQRYVVRMQKHQAAHITAVGHDVKQLKVLQNIADGVSPPNDKKYSAMRLTDAKRNNRLVNKLMMAYDESNRSTPTRKHYRRLNRNQHNASALLTAFTPPLPSSSNNSSIVINSPSIDHKAGETDEQ